MCSPNVQCRFFNEVKSTSLGKDFDGSGIEDGRMRGFTENPRQAKSYNNYSQSLPRQYRNLYNDQGTQAENCKYEGPYWAPWPPT